jgi:hypothetical protein
MVLRKGTIMSIVIETLDAKQLQNVDKPDRDALLQECRPLAEKRSILFELGKSLEGHGFAGSTAIPKTVFLATLTRTLLRPVSAVIKGPSSSGKSFALEAALRYVPAKAYEKFQGLSDRALVYSGDLDLRHRILVIGEAAGLADGNGRTFLRQLLTENEIRYRTVSQSKDGHAAKELIIKGPVGLLMTTTTNFLHGEDETRVLSLHIDQSPEQITRALEATMLTSQDEPSPEELAPWHALHNYVCSGDQRVQIPYDKLLIDRLPKQQRVLRDAQKIKALITAHALLHQLTRKRNQDGAIIAEIYDYYIVHDLIAEPLAQGLQASVPPHLREIVEAVAILSENSTQLPVGLSDVANLIGKDISSVSRNVLTAIRERYLEDQNPGRGRRSMLITGERALPSGSVLPSPREISEAIKSERESTT